MKKIKVYIVDDHRLFIDGLQAILKNVKDIEVVGFSLSGSEAIEALNNNRVDVLVTDISMPEMSGYDLVKIVSAKFPNIKVLTLSMHYEYSYIEKMIEVGSLGYVLKNTGAKELQNAIRVINEGNTCYSPKVEEAIIKGYSMEKVKAFKNIVKQEREIILTPREKDVLKLVVEAYSSSEIADMLGVSYHTITSHRKNINAKLGTSTIAEVIKLAKEKALI